jgi:hypothetical protein
MKLLVNVTICILLLLSVKEGNSQQFEVGSKAISAGMGIGYSLYRGTQATEVNYPPIYLAADFGRRDDIGPGITAIGAMFAFASSEDNVKGEGGYSYYHYIFGPRLSYHHNFFEKINTYTTFLLALEFNKANELKSPQFEAKRKFSPYLGFTIGASYNIQTDVALFAEMGLGVNLLALGVSVHL